MQAARSSDRGVIAVSGPEAKAFLQGLITNDLDRLSPGHALYGALLTPQGKLLYDFFLAEAEGAILLDVARADCPALVQRLTLYKLRAKIGIADRTDDLAVGAFWGEDVAERLALGTEAGAARAEAGGSLFIDPRLAEAGGRAILPEAALARRLSDAGPGGDYDAHRLALGLGASHEIGHEQCYPLEANLEALQGVDFKKGCYVGQELTARMKHRQGLRKRVLPVTAASDLPEPGSPVDAGGRELGTLLGARGRHGLALLRLDRLAEAASLPLTAAGVTLRVDWPAWLPR